jgi:hypothetical protein
VTCLTEVPFLGAVRIHGGDQAVSTEREDIPEVGVTDPRFVDTVEMLFMSYYGEPLGEEM